jgi:hypothetical protein
MQTKMLNHGELVEGQGVSIDVTDIGVNGVAGEQGGVERTMTGGAADPLRFVMVAHG